MASSRGQQVSEDTIGARVRSARASRFVGRRAELDLFERALDEPGSSFTVLFVHGPPGVGKSTLLRRFAALAADRDRRVALLDLRQVEATPDGVRRGLGAALDDGGGVGLDVLLLDTYEVASALDGWMRDHLVPRLPASALVVIAGRLPPSAGWTADPGWRPLVRVVALRNLRPDDAEELLAAEGLEASQRRQVLEETFGHPLALSLYLDLLIQRRGRNPAGEVDSGLLEAPDMVRLLLNRFVDEVPSPAHRAGVEVCAHVRFTTEELLRVALDAPPAEAAALFDWLRGLSFVEASPLGLFPHDLARDLLDSDLRWRDAAAYDALHRRVRRHFIGQVRAPSARDRHRAAADLVYLHRSNLLTRPFWDFSGLAQGYSDRLRPGDRDALVAMVAAHEGRQSAAMVGHWLDRQPDGFAVVRLGADPTPRGVVALLALHEATAEDLAADPGAQAMWDHAQRRATGGRGHAVTACRFLVDREVHQTPGSLTFGLAAAHHLQHILARSGRAMDFIGGMAKPEQVEPFFTYIDFLEAPDAAYEVDGRTWTVFARDWGRIDVDAWFEVIADRELGAPVEPVGHEPAAAPALALSQPDFAAAVRSALKDLHRPDRLRANPLLRSRLIASMAVEEGPAALAAEVRGAVDGLAADPRNERYRRALDRTFLRPAPSQERAAEVLGLPFSTYRRHLARGVELVVAALWDRELYGQLPGRGEQELSSERSGA